MKVSITLDLSLTQEEELLRYALVYGYQRIEPRKKWSGVERKQAIRFGATTLLNEAVKAYIATNFPDWGIQGCCEDKDENRLP